MALVLSQASAYNSGCELWICPQQQYSNWYSRLDWYINFRIAKFELKPIIKPNPQIESIIESCELPQQDIYNGPHIMIPCSENLPARWLVIVPFDGDLKSWCSSVQAVHENLKKPSLRVFLPISLPPHQFEAQWSEISGNSEYSIVADGTSS